MDQAARTRSQLQPGSGDDVLTAIGRRRGPSPERDLAALDGKRLLLLEDDAVVTDVMMLKPVAPALLYEVLTTLMRRG